MVLCVGFKNYSLLLLHLMKEIFMVSHLAYFLRGIGIRCYAINFVFSLVNALTPKALPDLNIC